MQKGTSTRVDAIASRDGQGRNAAASLGIARAYPSYESIAGGSRLDAVYIPLPNHLHVPWTIRAAEAGKHVLCEKPIALTAAEAGQLVDVRRRTGVLIEEAFMVRTHPQWLRARAIVRSGQIGPLRSIVGTFSYFNDDPGNVRNVVAYGGGALLDIGCYLVNTARMMFEAEPSRVCALIDRDPVFGVDRLTSLMLDFPGGQAIGTCGTQLAAGQGVVLAARSGASRSLPVQRPAGPSVTALCRIPRRGWRHDSRGARHRRVRPVHDPGRSVLGGDPPRHARTVPLEDSIANLRVIDALFRSAETNAWQAIT